jgi:cation diffusion facilitator CzcD-associated flavoprotein CzcO
MATTRPTHFDAIVIGTGFAGIYMLHKLRNEVGLSVRAFDRAGGVGGTWYWNRYPGAAADVDSYMYRYSFDRELLQEFNWKTRYEPQHSILAYLEKVVDKHDLRGNIQLNTWIESLVFDEERNQWTVRTDSGDEFTARWVVSALGPLSHRNFPAIEGLDTFAGPVVHTGAWPEDLDITGKRVGVVGTGSTGTQFICAAAPVVEHLTVFQRSAQYVVPSGDRPLSDEELADIRKNYDKIWEDAFNNTRLACGFHESETPAMSVSPEERERIFEEGWQAGNGFYFMFGLFADLIFDPEANKAATDFIKSKIKEIVRDPETARKLTPSDYFAKRPICNTGYYETFNRENVSLVSLPETPITRITPTGVVTADGTEHELDVLVFATGFEAMDGSYNRMDIRGRGGETLKEHWADQPTSYLGIAVSGFPNLFMVFGPNSAFSNLPPGLETQVEWIADFVRAAEERGLSRVEATAAAEQEWSTMCREMALQSLFAQTDSWIFGTNIPGKHQRSMFFFGGIATYRQTLREIAAADYTGFTVETQPSLTPA